MPLTPGERLGPYEISAMIGKGGMGEVYRAHDPRLGRDVALKVSAKQFTERFEREARAIAALNHPNICTLYDVGPNYLVMEFVEGASPKGPMELDEALRIADQIAAALEAAHDKGITHRDLKPGNVMVKPDGLVKVLDFGLAKITSDAPAPYDATLTLGATQPGQMLGTPAYMAPEQARGKPADKRADIWAFGVLLHELLTGQRLFKGEDLTEVLASVVKDAPDLNIVPRRVRRLLDACLKKDPAKRLQSIADMRLLLDEETPEPVGQAVLPPAAAPSKLWPRLAAALALGLGALAAWTFYPRPAAPDAGAIRFTIAPPEGATITANIAAGPQMAVSPDGRYLAFVADGKDGERSIWVRALGSLAAQKLDKTDNANLPFWSPDSQHIAFFAGNKLKRIPVSGGSPLNIADVEGGDGGSWMQDANGEGFIVFAPSQVSTLQRVPAAGGVSTPFSKLMDGETGHSHPQFLPHRKHVLYFARGSSKPGIYAQELGSEERTFVLQTQGRAVFAPPNFLLFVNDGTLMSQRFDPDTLTVQGEPVSVANEVGSNATNGRSAFSVSTNGVLAYRGGSAGNQYQLRWYTRDGKAGDVALPPGPYGHIELSPDDKRLVVRRGDGDSQDLWLLELTTGVFSRLTSSPGAESQPVWAPDSRQIAFVQSTAKGPEIRETVIGSGKESVVYADGKTGLLEDWTRDGKRLLIRFGNTVSAVAAPEEGSAKPAESKPQVLLDTPFTKDQFRVSPDGKWVVYNVQDASGTPYLSVAEFPSFNNRRQVTVAAAAQPLWRSDGKELFFNDGSGNVMSMEVKAGATFETGPVRKLFHSGLPRNQQVQLFAVTRDGQRFLVLEPPGVTANTIEPLYVIANWPALVK